MTYENSRPHIPAEIERQVMTEAGHKCSVKHCPEHIVEKHHIDMNRENNTPENLIILCAKHHKLAHSGVISRKDLMKYKRLLIEQPTPAPSASVSDHDRNLLNKINELFPYNIIQDIKDEPFGSFVQKHIINQIDMLLYQSNDPLFSFTNQHLEQLKNDAIKKAQIFIRHFSQQSAGGLNGYDYINLNEIRQRNPSADIEYYKQYSIETQNLANDFCDTILLLRNELRNF